MWWQICVFFRVDLFEFAESLSSSKLPLTDTNIALIYLYLFPRKKWESWKNSRKIRQRFWGSGRNTLTALAPKGPLTGKRELSSSFRMFDYWKQESYPAHYQNAFSALNFSEG
jgi:hypothetical protein